MNFLQSEKKTIAIMFAIYITANITVLLNYNGIYWDDWVLYGHSLETINNMFMQAVGHAAYPTSVLHYTLLHLGNGIIGYRILTVALLFLSGVFVYKILQTLNSFSNEDRFFITLFFLLAPLYNAKIALINFPYTFYSAFFFFAFYLLSKYINTLGALKRGFILFLFFTSFLVNSLLVFYAIVLLYMFYKLYDTQSTSLKNSIVFIQTKIDFILLPIVFYIIKSIYFVPSAAYVGYNSISFGNILNLDLYFQAFELSFIEPIMLSVQHITSFYILTFMILLLFSNFFSRQNNEMKTKHIYLFVLGFMLFFLGVFPYQAVGKMPNLNDWESRFQLLLPLGFAFILYYGVKITSNLLNFKQIIKHFVYIVLLASFILFNVKEQYVYNIDWMYQQSIIQNLKESKFIQKHNTFILNIELEGKLAKNRSLRFYELNGMSKQALSRDSKLFVKDKSEMETAMKYQKYKEYNFINWNYSPPIQITIADNPGSQFNTSSSIKKVVFLLKLKYWESFNKEKFSDEIKKIITLNYSDK